MGFSKSSSKRGVYNDTILPQETRKVLNRQPNSTSKATGKRRTKTNKKKSLKSTEGKKSKRQEQK